MKKLKLQTKDKIDENIQKLAKLFPNVIKEGRVDFEVLKIIQESYLNKIKMIYIDPPYNTGKDFIYKDNFTKNKNELEEDIEAVDSEGVKLYKNTDSNGRFHSDWLSMMYERPMVARDLLKDDSFANDSDKINFEQTIKELSPESDIWVA